MKRIDSTNILPYVLLIVLFCVLMNGWDAIITFLGILLTAIIPLVLGFAIAYVVGIPVCYLERHLLPHSKSPVVKALRRPVALLVSVTVLLGAMVFSSMELMPALTETIRMVQLNGRAFIMSLLDYELFAPLRESVTEFMEGEVVQALMTLDVPTLAHNLFGGAIGNLGSQLFGVVNGIMTGFFALLFSFILLTDTSEVADKFMLLMTDLLGSKRVERLAMSLGIVDVSFHNFIVRQFVEALILGGMATVVLIVAHFPYALGTGVLMGLAALVPIVGYPIGLFLTGFMVVINNPLLVLVYVPVVAVTQVIESTRVLPRIGDPRTTIPPVLVTVGVTIGGGVAGFAGMLVAIPLAASIFQLLRIDARLVRARREKKAQTEDDD